MKKLCLSMLLFSLFYVLTSLAYADTEYGVYWMDNPENPQLAFKIHERGEPRGIGHGFWYGAGMYQGWKGQSLNFAGPLSFALIHPKGTASMVFYGTSMDRTGKNGWRGEIMFLNQQGQVVHHDAWIK